MVNLSVSLQNVYYAFHEFVRQYGVILPEGTVEGVDHMYRVYNNTLKYWIEKHAKRGAI